MHPRKRTSVVRRGVASVVALLFVVLAAAMAIALYATSTGNVVASDRHADASRAQAAADSGLEWFAWRLREMDLPTESAGTISPAVAAALWPDIRDAISNDLAPMGTNFTTYDAADDVLRTSSFRISDQPVDLRLEVRQHPIPEDDSGLDARFIRVTAVAIDGEAERRASVDFQVEKKIRYAVVSKTRIQIGRNVVVEGPMGMSDKSRTPPYLILSDFAHLDSDLTELIGDYHALLESLGDGFDGRLPAGTDGYSQAVASGFSDYDGNAVIDEFDIFLAFYDTDADRAVSVAEFTDPSTGKLYDANLFSAIDTLGAKLSDADVDRAGFDDGYLDVLDGYGKVKGQLTMAITQQGWEGGLGSQTIHDMIKGPIITDRTDQTPLKFGATTSDIFDLNPANFDQCAENFRAKSGTAGGTTSVSGSAIRNTTLTAAMANGGTVNERTPFGSVSYQATYRRPVFRNMTFQNVIIPKGLNALFDNCTFEGVTFVDSERTITRSTGQTTFSQSDGMSWAQRKISGENFSKDRVLLGSGTPTTGQSITRGSRDGNNLRFHNCTILGPMANNYSTAYTHFANSWEFTGATRFDNQADDTATIVAPQTNIEMGSFTNPGQAPSTLIGVVVAGNIDIRGTSVVDGSIIVTGDGAGNTTLGYFGSSDSDTNPSAMPEGGYGRLSLRYNPNRALPDGISLPVDLEPVAGSYREGQ